MVRPWSDRTLDYLTAPALSELTVHRHDIAPGTGRAVADPRRAREAHHGHCVPRDVAVGVDAGRGVPVTYEIRLRGNGPRYVIRVADGTADVRAVGGPVDCVISADPVTYLLVCDGRMSLGRALLGGGILAWGRRLWLGLRFKDLFFNP